MKGIKVIYKPILALKPAHVAVVCVLEQPCLFTELSGRLPLSDIVLENVVEELSFWNLVVRNQDELELTGEGKVAVEALKATEKRGSWECADDGTWILGEGKFELPETLADLASAGWDPETGQKLTEAVALRTIKERHSTLAKSEAYANSGVCADEVGVALHKGVSFAEAVESVMNRTFSAVHLTRVSDQLVSSLANSKLSSENYNESLRTIHANKKVRLRQIQLLQRDSQRAIWVMLAQWLGKRDGVLGEMLRKRGSAFRCISTIGVPLWEVENEPKGPSFSRFESEQSETRNGSGGFLSWFGDMVSSILR